ncbi:hypothetical protein BGW38_004815 [Lunasporangiospora selenospora]|uniref:Transmembrane protein 18 n=1 Tax=Lunasporangiospora selenospora TaxID=979761 RepID=A0A9P6KBS1_9FUNG|nr:hypothetical protein BGW38_004815 [Lunasporangiospora selenospora]
MDAATAAAHEATASGSASPISTSQFWSDFWNTLYQFTHPFSSTFFDSLFEAASSNPLDPQASADSSQQQQSKKSSPPLQQQHYFKDQSAFEQFWKQLQNHPTGHGGSAPASFTEHLNSSWDRFKTITSDFIAAVEWQQTWIQLVLALHLVIFFLIILLRNRPNALAGMLFSTLVLAALSEPLNGIGSRHWQQFSDDNYFDTHGVFAGIVWAAPLLLNSFLAMILLLRAAARLLIRAKRAQLRQRKQKKNK